MNDWHLADDPNPWPRLRWHWRRHRARHYAYLANLAYRDDPTPRNGAAWARAVEHLRHVETGQP